MVRGCLSLAVSRGGVFKIGNEATTGARLWLGVRGFPLGEGSERGGGGSL